MITSPLSQRQDLVEGLDADAILDYLTHHRVLDPAILVGLEKGKNPTHRNSVILRHVEAHGDTAVALFINALRQSGQLHLASSLDNEQRIKPLPGNGGYFGKSRHTGQVTIRVEVEWLKILAPREPRTDKVVDASLLDSMHGDAVDGDKVVVVVDDEDVVKPRSCWCFCFSKKSKSRKSSRSRAPKSRSPSSRSSSKRKKGGKDKDVEQVVHPCGAEGGVNPSGQSLNPNNQPPNITLDLGDSRDSYSAERRDVVDASKTGKSKNKASSKEKKKEKKSKNKSKGKGKSGLGPSDQKDGVDSTVRTQNKLSDIPDLVYRAGEEEAVIIEEHLGGATASPQRPSAYQSRTTQSSHHEPDVQSYRSSHHPSSNQRQDASHARHQYQPQQRGASLQQHGRSKPAKENWDPIVMEYDPKLELVKLRAGQEELSSPTRQQAGNTGMMCEQWKSSGRHFIQKASQLCERIIQDCETSLVKYFEQSRGTLVLDVVYESSAILISNICMKKSQVTSLQKDVEDESLLDKLQDIFFSTVNIATFDIRGIKLKIVLEEREVNAALSEFS